MFAEALIELLKTTICNSHNILITSHFNPDGDAVGAALGWGRFLNSFFDKKVHILLPNDPPNFLNWLYNEDEILIYKKNSKFADEIIDASDLIFSMDYNAFSRVKLFDNRLIKSTATKVLIDHHIEHSNEYNIYFSDIKSSSTCEIVYNIISQLKAFDYINKSIADSIYLGIMTDTGSFSFSCNSFHTFDVVSNLVKKGVDIELVNKRVYDTFSENRLRLLGFCLSERLTTIPEFNTAYIYLSLDDLSKFGYMHGFTEGFVNYALSLKEVAFAAIFIEQEDKIRISFRSKGSFSVNDFARLHFAGGGHKNAAGGNSSDSLSATIERFISIVPKYNKEIKAALLEIYNS